MKVQIKTKENKGTGTSSYTQRVFAKPMYFENTIEDIKIRTVPIKVDNPDENTFKAYAKTDEGEHELSDDSGLVVKTVLMGEGKEITKEEYDA